MESHKYNNSEEGKRLVNPESVDLISPISPESLRYFGALAQIDGKKDKTGIILPALRHNDGNPYDEANHVRYTLGEQAYRAESISELAENFPHLGLENEFHILDSEGNPVWQATELLETLKELDTNKEFGVTPELFNCTVEMGTETPARTLAERKRQYETMLYTVLEAAESHGWRVSPFSSLPGEEVAPEHINQHPYIQRMANDYLGWEKAGKFPVVGGQDHIEAPSPWHAARAATLLDPMLSGAKVALHSSPFDGTQASINYEHLYDGETLLKNHEVGKNQGIGSYRDVTRRYGLTTGGAIQFPISAEEFNDPKAFTEFIARRSLHELPDRPFAAHAMRPRGGIGETGTLEICSFDNGGHRAERQAAMNFLVANSARFAMSLPSGMQGDAILEELAKQYPAIFWGAPRNENGAERTLSWAKQTNWNDTQVALHGKRAVLKTPNGIQFTPRQALEQQINFVDSYAASVPSEIKKELLNSFEPADKRDPFKSYYQKGVSNMSECAIEYYQRCTDSNLSETGRLRQMNVAAANALHDYGKQRREQ